MLEGLEVSEVNISLINREKRINSEYFLKEYITEDNYLAKHNVVSIGEYAFITDGQHGYHEIDNNSNIHLLTAKNAKNWFANLDGADPLAQWVDDYNRRSSLQNNDIILSTRGSIGYAAIVKADVLPANIDQDVARINIIKQNELIPEFTITYLNSKYGQNWMFRNQTGMVQQGLSLEKVREMPIPLLPIGFQQNVAKIVQKSYVCFNESNNRYLEAEKSLLKELGLLDWQPNNDNTSIKHFIDFLSSGRLDAEYYQPKYDEIETNVRDYKNGYKQVKDYFVQNKDVSDFSRPEYYYIEIGDVNINNGMAEFNLLPTEDLPDNAKRVLCKNDLLVSKVRPYRGAVTIVNEEYDNLIGSGAFTVLREKGLYKKEVLQVLLRTPLYKEWLCKWSVGSSYPVIKDEDVLNLPIPNIPEKTQQAIADYVQKSVSLRQQAKQLLEDAKHMVEQEIGKK